MARVVGVFNPAHSPFLYMPPERWNEVRAGRALREDVPFDDLETNKQKKDRIEAAFATMRQRMAALNPDVVIIFGDDQYECFDSTTFPAFAVYVGEDFAPTDSDRGG